MKIIHCADLHLDSKLRTHLSKIQAKERRIELLQTFSRMVAYAQEQNVRAIIIAGDMFDTKLVSATARNSVIKTVTDHPEIDFYYLKGNHDADGFLSALEEIPDNMKLFDNDWISCPVEPDGRSPVVITGVELNAGNENIIYNSLVLAHDKFNIVVLHGQESNYRTGDKTECVNLGALRSKGIDYLALGHIHTYKCAELDKRGVYCYSGCLEGRGFDECGECGFVLLDIDEERKTLESRFIPFAARNLYLVPVNISECMTSAEIACRIDDVLKSADYHEKSLVRVVLTGDVDVECEKNLEYLLRQFGADYYLFEIKDKTKLAVDYNSFALDQSLKGEFVRTVNASQLDDDTKAEVIRCGIRALAGEEMELG